jgi:hypothetical protein
MQTSNVITFEAISQALVSAEARYLAKNPTNKDGIALTHSADIAKARKRFLNEHSVKVLSEGLSKAGIESFLDDVSQRMGTKAIMRCFEFANALASGNYKHLDATTCLTMFAVACAGVKTRSAVSFAVTGAGDDNTSDVVRDTALVRKLQQVFPKIGTGTEPTQVSRSFGENGFCKYLGIGFFKKDGNRYAEMQVKTGNPFYKTARTMIEKASEVTLATMKGGKNKDE